MRRQTIASACICATVLLSVFAVSSCRKSSAEKTWRMRASTPLAAHGTVGRALKMFCDLVQEKSNGRIKTADFYIGELGNQRELVEMAHDGSLEVVTSLASGTARYVPQLALFEYPYIYKNEDHLVRVLDAMEDDVSALLARHNFIAVGGQNMGFRHMLNKKRPITTVADLKGLKMRGPNPIYVGMFKALGANGTTTDWSEIYIALQTGIIDGIEASPDMLLSMKFNEQAKYLSKTSHIAACVYYMIRKDWFESLPQDLQQIVTDCARQAAAYQNALDIEVQSEALKTLAAEGVQINEVNNIDEFKQQLADFKKSYVADKPTAWQQLYDKIIAVE
ncbi:MAG: TRAP transporter substrate-binding protein [Planctomycetes bacterium]|nr:TRAP transporter substrate-binding protein [Planctomycetota bacterium]